MDSIRLVKVHTTELTALREYVEALYKLDEDYDSIVNIETGLTSLMRNDALATPFFIKRGDERIGYVILTRYHSVEKGGLTMYIDELYVEEQFRRKGVGREILAKILEIARAQQVRTLWAQTEPYNDAAQSFFTAAGFQVNPNKNFEMPL